MSSSSSARKRKLKESDSSPSMSTLKSVKTVASSIPVVVKTNAWKKDVMVIQSVDEDINFKGDSGAVGRLTVEDGKMIMDIKGRQYSGKILSGPLVMVLNLTQSVAAKVKKTNDENVDKDDDASKDKSKSKTKEHQHVARVEMATNEFCELKFEQDMLSTLKGEYRGEMLADDLQEGDVQLRKNAPKISTLITKKRSTTKKGAPKKKAKTK
jgi:hypothetical protein